MDLCSPQCSVFSPREASPEYKLREFEEILALGVCLGSSVVCFCEYIA